MLHIINTRTLHLLRITLDTKQFIYCGHDIDRLITKTSNVKHNLSGAFLHSQMALASMNWKQMKRTPETKDKNSFQFHTKPNKDENYNLFHIYLLSFHFPLVFFSRLNLTIAYITPIQEHWNICFISEKKIFFLVNPFC